MEIPDIIVVNKADHPMTDTMVREIRGVLSLGDQPGWRVPIVRTQAHKGEGVEQLAEKLVEHRAYVEEEGQLAERRRRNLLNEVIGIATHRLRRALEAAARDDEEIGKLLDQVVARELDPASAASAVLTRGGFDPAEAAREDQKVLARRRRGACACGAPCARAARRRRARARSSPVSAEPSCGGADRDAHRLAVGRAAGQRDRLADPRRRCRCASPKPALRQQRDELVAAPAEARVATGAAPRSATARPCAACRRPT